MAEERKIQLVAEVDTRKVDEGFTRIEQGAVDMASTVGKAGKAAQKAVDDIGSGAGRSSAKVEASQRSIINSIQRTTAAMESGSKTSAQYYEALAKTRGVDPNALAPYLKQLRDVESAQKKVGTSAAQTAAALRGVPAQITDIVTSLQGGQQPLTVLLQQGGQLRDMFGSVGGAAKALGSTVLGLINPFTVAAAAAVALAVAYNQGSKEADAYNKALITTGNAAGVTADQLASLAQSIDESSSSITQGAAAEALAALAATGKVQRENLKSFAKTAVEVQKTVGTSIQETAKNFADLGKAPLSTIERLNEGMNFLTADIRGQIKALEDVGKVTEAAALAQNTYNDALTKVSGGITERLGTVEKAWKSVTDVAKETWDAMLGVGREKTLDERLKDAQKNLEAASKNRFGFIGAGQFRDAQRELDAVQKQIRGEERLAELARGKAEFNSAELKWQELTEKSLDKRAKLEQDIAKIRNTGLAAGRSDDEIESEVKKKQAEIDKEIDSERKKQLDEQKKAYQDLVASQIEGIRRRGEVEETVAARSRDALEARRSAGLVNERDFLQAQADLDAAALTRQKSALEAELRLASSLKDQAALRGQIAKVDEQALTRRLKLQGELTALDIKEATQSQQAANARVTGLDAANAALEKQVRAQRDANAQIGLSQDQIAQNNLALAEEAAQRKEVEAAILDTILGRDQEADALRESAKLIRENAQAAREGMLKAADFDRQKSFWTSLEDTARQTFISIANGGKGAAQRLKDTFKNVFFDWLYQMTIKKWIINVGASLGVSGGVFGTAQAANGLLGAAGGGASGALGMLGGILPGAAQTAGALLAGNIGVGSTLGAGFSALTSGTLSGATAGLSSVIGVAAPVIVGAMLAKNVFDKAFGRGPREVTGQGITGTFSGGTFSGQSFEEWMRKGGWFSSTKRGTDTRALSTEQQTAFNTAFKSVQDSTKAYADALGLSTDAITGYSKEIKLTLTNDKAENEKLIAEVFKGIGDDIANALLPSISGLAKEGESAAATLARVATQFTSLNDVFKAVGIDADKAFGAVGVASLSAREKLITLAGGIDSLVSQTAFFGQNFLTEAERIAPVQKQVTDALAALGKSSITTVEQFKEAVLSLQNSGALATEEGQKAFAGLLAIAPQFKAVADYLEKTKTAAEELAKTNLAEQLEKAKSAAQSSFSALSAAIGREREAITSRFSGLLGGISSAIDSTANAIQGSRNILQAARDALRNFALPGQEADIRAAARKRLADLASGGAALTEDSVRTAISEGTQLNESDFANEFEFRLSAAETRNSLKAIEDRAEKQISDQERALTVIQGWQAEYMAQQAIEFAKLDSQLTVAQQQLDSLNGINNSVLSLRDATAAFASAISAANAAKSVGAATGVALPGTGGTSTSPNSSVPNGFFWWEGTDQDRFFKPPPAPVSVAPDRVVPDQTINSMAGVESRLESLEMAMTSGLMTVASNTKESADVATQWNLQGQPPVRD